MKVQGIFFILMCGLDACTVLLDFRIVGSGTMIFRQHAYIYM